MGGGLAQNELVMRIQPHESIYMKTLTKEPGLENHPKAPWALPVPVSFLPPHHAALP